VLAAYPVRAATARADGEGPAVTAAAGVTPPRLRLVDGEVSFWRPGAEDWAPAHVNTPLAAGDSLYASSGANAEIEIARQSFIRAGSEAEIGLEGLEPDFLQLKLTSGHLALDLPRLPEDHTIEIDTPNAAFTVTRAGYFRIDVDQDTTTFAARKGGEGTLTPADGDTVDVRDGEQANVAGATAPKVDVHASADLDEWDRWNFDRSRPRTATAHAAAPSGAPAVAVTELPADDAPSARYVSDEVAGAEDLDDAGDWRETPEYGHVWVPRDVAADWAPYTAGRWVYDPAYGWSWVDNARWGWAPFHYGRWVHTAGAWGWVPGPVPETAVYSPALVAFMSDGDDVVADVDEGEPVVGWVPLGFGEPVIPWWGAAAIIGHAYWGGWSGPRVVNNVVVSQNTTVVNVRNITKYQNVGMPNAVAGLGRRSFARGGATPMRLAATRVNELRPVRGTIGVKPTANALVARTGNTRRPPQSVAARSVVATRAPQELSPRLRQAGLNARPAVANQSRSVRLVNAPARPTRVGTSGQPAGGRPGAAANRMMQSERQHQAPVTAHAAPPPPPHASGNPAASAGAGERRAVAPVPPGHRPMAQDTARSPRPMMNGAAQTDRHQAHAAPPPPPSSHAAAPSQPGRPSQASAPNAADARRQHEALQRQQPERTQQDAARRQQEERQQQERQRVDRQRQERQQQDAQRRQQQEHQQQDVQRRQQERHQQEALRRQQQERGQQDARRRQEQERQQNVMRRQQQERSQQDAMRRQQTDRQQQESMRRQQQQQQSAARAQQERAEQQRHQAQQQDAARRQQQDAMRRQQQQQQQQQAGRAQQERMEQQRRQAQQQQQQQRQAQQQQQQQQQQQAMRAQQERMEQQRRMMAQQQQQQEMARRQQEQSRRQQCLSNCAMSRNPSCRSSCF
jgi:hypothetical protein